MEPWQKLMETLCEIWVEEDIKNGKVTNEKRTEDDTNGKYKTDEDFYEAA